MIYIVVIHFFLSVVDFFLSVIYFFLSVIYFFLSVVHFFVSVIYFFVSVVHFYLAEVRFTIPPQWDSSRIQQTLDSSIPIMSFVINNWLHFLNEVTLFTALLVKKSQLGQKEEIRINLVDELSIKCTNFQKCSITAYTRGCMPRIHRGVQHHRIHPGVHALHNLHRMKWCQAFFC